MMFGRLVKIFLLALPIMSGIVFADAPSLGEAKTESGYIFCHSYSEWYHYTNLLASGDPAGRKKFDSEPTCGWLAEGITVYVNERMDSLFAVKFSVDGETWYTSTSALYPPNQPPPQTKLWAVQLGSFEDKENAESLAAALRKQGFASFVSSLSVKSGALYRVRVGPQKDRESAESMAGRLQRAGHKGEVVAHP
jgi:hypothetical protein